MTYDSAGNQTATMSGVSLGYDAENRQTSFAITGASQELYDYDGEGRRVRHQHQTWVNGAWTTPSNSTTLYVYDAFGKLAAEYGAQSANSPCVTCYLTTDMLGSTRLMTDENGIAKARYDYLPFGQEILPPSSGGRASVMCGTISCYGQGGAINQKFTGKERDAETGLDHFLFRYNSSAQGRFTTPDPINLTAKRLLNPANTLNKYVYGGNNPLLYVDPTGRDITVFYRAPSGAWNDFGHIMLAVTNQATGQVRFADYYNQNGNTFSGPGVMNQPTAERLKEDAALTIQTNPGVAQELINDIDTLTGNKSTYVFVFHDCATVCADLLNLAGIDAPSLAASPTNIWSFLYSKYSSEALNGGQLKMGLYRYQPGQEFGSPMSAFPNGTDPFSNLELLYMLANQQNNQPPPRACVTTNDGLGNVTTWCD
jgi:RHS repeat-associated protein